MKPITIWQVIEHNHIEDGHSDKDMPEAQTSNQEKSWKDKKWIRTHGYLDENNKVIKIVS